MRVAFPFQITNVSLVCDLRIKSGLDKRERQVYNEDVFRGDLDDIELVLIRVRVHPFPFRTR